MLNRLSVLVFLTVIVSLVCGCEPAGSKPSEIVHSERPRIEPEPVEIPEAEPIETPQAEPVETPEAEPVETPEVEPVEIPEAEPVEIPEAEPIKTPETEPADVNQPSTNSLYDQMKKLFRTYVDNTGMVNYKVLRRKRRNLASLMRDFGNVTLSEYDSWDPAEKKAFWINAYNLCVIKIVIDNYPIKPSRYLVFFGYPANSIMQISYRWTTQFEFEIMAEKYTPREIERGILLRRFDDPRICFALSYATLSSPALRNEPYTGRLLDKQLDEQVRDFILSGGGFRIDRSKKKVYLAAILKDSWYGNFFISKYGTQQKFIDKEASERAVLNFISNYLPRKDRDLLVNKEYTIEYIKYDWALNGQ